MSTGLDVAEVFRRTRAALVEAGIDHAFIGAFAAVAWGRTRATSDVDLVAAVDAEGWRSLEAILLRSGFRTGGGVGEQDPETGLPDIEVLYSAGEPSVRLDLFVAKMEFERVVISTAREVSILGAPARVASPEAVLIYKLLADRRKDNDDVEHVLEARRYAGDVLDWSFIDYWAAEWGISDRLAPWRARFGPEKPAER